MHTGLQSLFKPMRLATAALYSDVAKYTKSVEIMKIEEKKLHLLVQQLIKAVRNVFLTLKTTRTTAETQQLPNIISHTANYRQFRYSETHQPQERDTFPFRLPPILQLILFSRKRNFSQF